jgi:hypothetical protein
MPRALSPEKEREFEELTGFLRFYLVHCEGLSEAAFNQGSAEIAEKFGRSKALVGLRQAVNDTIEELAHANSEAVAALDRALSERGFVSFSELRRRYSADYKRLLERGNIRNDTEFYLVSGVVSDLAADIPAGERAQLQLMLETYERVA